jgi:hypothetical protein
VCHGESAEPLRLGQFTIASESDHAAERTRPILVSASGGPGRAELMRMLAGDPAIVAADSLAHGVRLMTYYAHALEVLVVPSTAAPADRHGAIDDGTFVLAPNPFHTPDSEHLFPQPRLLYEFFQNQSKAKIAAAFKAVVADFYETLAMHQGKRMAAYFAEQCDLFDIARNFARMAFRDIREIVLVQDPRDAYCTCRTLWFTAPSQALAKLRRVRDRALELRRENRHDTMFLRCEDLWLRPAGALHDLSRFLSLDHVVAADPALLRAMTDDPPMPGIAYWKDAMDSNDIVMFQREFGEYLNLFGYESTMITAA